MSGRRGKSSRAGENAVDIGQLMRDGKAIDRAIRAAARDALELHMRLNNPIAVWDNEKVVWMDPKTYLAGLRKNRTASARKKTRRKSR